MDLPSKWLDRARSGAPSARCLSGLHFRVWRRGVSMMAVTVVCDEKSMVDKACEWGHSLLPHKAGSNDVGCSSGPFSKSARRGAPGRVDKPENLSSNSGNAEGSQGCSHIRIHYFWLWRPLFHYFHSFMLQSDFRR